MKKLLAMGVLTLCLAACSSGESTSSTGDTAGSVSGTATVAVDDGEITATVTKDADGKIEKVVIDQIQDGNSKKDLKEDYGMKDASGIGKEWYEQIAYLETYIVDNGVDAVKLDADGYPEGEDLRAGCTINLSKIMEAVDDADAKA